jgi:SPOR domain
MSEQIEHSGLQSGPRLGPQSAPRSGPMYRPSHDDDQGMDAGTRRLLYLGGAGGLAIMAAIAVYSLAGHSGGNTVPVVTADARPLRVKPENPGGMTVAPEETRANPANSRLAPGTEEPNPRALMAMPDSRNGIAPLALSPAHAKTVTVQLMAAKSEAGAQSAWDKLTKQLPEVVASHRPLFQKVNETGTAPWRLRTGGFADPAQAKAFCDKIKAKGGQCALVES